MTEQQPALNTHWHWKFLAYNGPEVTDGGPIHWPVAVHVTGYECEVDAKIAAQAIVTRDHYVLNAVYDCVQCGFQATMSRTMTDLAKAATH